LTAVSVLVGGCGGTNGDFESNEKFDPGPRGALATTQGYFDALLSGDAEAACSYFPPQARQEAPGCEAAFEIGLRDLPEEKSRELEELRSQLGIENVSVSGHVATVEVPGKDLDLVEIGDAWYVTRSD